MAQGNATRAMCAHSTRQRAEESLRHVHLANGLLNRGVEIAGCSGVGKGGLPNSEGAKGRDWEIEVMRIVCCC